MSGPIPSSLSRAAIVLAAGAMLSFGATASYADNAQQLEIVRGAHASAPYSAHALYPQRAISPYATDNRSDECIGGYRWIQRYFDPNRDPAETSIPVRCR